MAFIKAIVKRPEEEYGHMCNISDRLSALQMNVGGYIETVTIDSKVTIICDEEGRLKGYEPCGYVGGVHFVGTIIAVGWDKKGSFTDIPISMKEWKEKYFTREEEINANHFSF